MSEVQYNSSAHIALQTIASVFLVAFALQSIGCTPLTNQPNPIATGFRPTTTAPMVYSSPRYFDVPPGELRVQPYSYTVYLMKGEAQHLFDFLGFYYKESGSLVPNSIGQPSAVQSQLAGCFQVGGHVEKLDIASGDEAILNVTSMPSDMRMYSFFREGTVDIRITLAGRTHTISVDVVELPLARGMQGSDVLSAMGMPSTRDSFWVDWPDHRSVDGIFYEPEAGSGGIGGEHWRYAQYPHLVVSIVHGLLETVNTGRLSVSDSAYHSSDATIRASIEAEMAEYREWSSR